MKIREHWALDTSYEEDYRAERRHLLIAAGAAVLSMAAVAFGITETVSNDALGPVAIDVGAVGGSLSVGGVAASIKILGNLERQRIKGLEWARGFRERHSQVISGELKSFENW